MKPRKHNTNPDSQNQREFCQVLEPVEVDNLVGKLRLQNADIPTPFQGK